MPCSRCGQNRPSRNTPPSRSGRSGTGGVHPAQQQGQGSSNNHQNVRDAISGLRYVPSK